MKRDYRLVGSLTAAGILSGLVSSLFPLSAVFTGAWLGLAIVAYLFVFRRFRSPTRGLGFVAVSAAAYYAAMMSAMFAPLRIESLDFLNVGSPPPRSDQMLFAGIVGGFIVFLAAYLLFCPQKKIWPTLLEAFLWSLPCGILGVAGWSSGPVLGKALWVAFPRWLTTGDNANDAPYIYSLFLVWQTGAGVLLGIALAREAARSDVLFSTQTTDGVAAPRRVRASIPALILVAAGFLTVGWLFVRTFPQDYSEWRWRRAWQKHVAQTPTLDHLPAIIAMPVDQALVVHDVGKYKSWSGSSGQVRYGAPGYPPTMQYQIDYLDPDLPPPPGSSPVAECKFINIQLPAGRNSNCGNLYHKIQIRHRGLREMGTVF